jgi:putative Mg2+ transporter-C (MgtC) family protein
LKYEKVMEILRFTINVGAALLMGVAIGLERQFRQRTAGLRTNTLVCLGAALFVSLGQLLEPQSTRIAAQVVSGIGFLGAGVILREGLNVRGMNTAATLWCSAAIGTLAGMGYLVEGLIGTGAVLLLHLGLRPLVRKIDSYSKTIVEVDTLYRIRVECPSDQEGVIRTILLRHVNSKPPMSLQGISTQDTDSPEKTVIVAEVLSSEHGDRYMNEIVSRISVEPKVTTVSWEKMR